MQVNIPVRAQPLLARDSVKALSKSKFSLNPVSKRKRDEIDDSEDGYDSGDSPDAQLARELQDEMGQMDQMADKHMASRLPVLQSARTRAPLPSLPRPSSIVAGPSTTKRKSIAASRATAKAASKRFVVDDSEDSHSDENYSEVYIPPSKIAKTRAKSAPRRKVKAPKAALDDQSDSESGESESDFEDNQDEENEGEDEGVATTADDSVPRSPIVARRGYRAYRSKKRAMSDREKLEHQHPVLKTMWDVLEKMPILKVGKVEQPKAISRVLKPFQLEGVAWMMATEKQTEWKGGLLGDEMGLGKTIQAVSLIMSDYPAHKPSLVLAPPVALMQWTSEIQSYTDGTLKTIVYHGTNAKTRNMSAKDLKQLDVIIMSYNSLESMYRKQEKGFKRKEGVYKEKSIIHQTRFHRVILDEAHCIKVRQGYMRARWRV